jgi:MFS family permease
MTGLRDVLRHRDLRLLLAGQAVSQAGDWLYNVALIVYVIDATGSAAWVAAVELAHLVPWIIMSPIGGLMADRIDRRRLLIAGDLVQVVTMLALAALAAAGGSPSLAIVIALVASLTQVAQSPSLQASIPALVDERGLASVNALMSAIMNVAIIVGPAVGAVLLILGSPAAAFAANAISFLVSAACFALIRTPMGPIAATKAGANAPESAEPDGQAARAGSAVTAAMRAAASELAGGAAALRASPTALTMVLVAAGGLFAYGMQTVLWAVLADERLGVGTDAITLLYVASGIGGLLATVPASRAGSGRSAARILAAGAAIGGLSVAALGLSDGLPPAMALIGLQGFVISIVDILAITILQRALGPAVLGRALGAMDSLTSVAMVAGTILAPILVSVAGLGVAFAVGGVALTATGIIAFVFGRREAAPAAASEARVQLLAGLSLFSGAPRFALEGLAADCRELRVPADEAVIREGDAPDALYVLVDGAAVVTSGAGGRLNTMAAGDFFGEIGLLKGVPRTATVTTTEPSTLLRIEGDVFLSLVRTGVAQRGILGRSVGVRLSERRGPGVTGPSRSA